jgi:F0F1-type ATP synthase delta subunit
MNRVSRRALARYAADQLLGGASPAELAGRLAASLVESGRAADRQFLLEDIAWELEQRGELVIGHATTAIPLNKSLEAALKAQLKETTKAREILLEKHIDKAILGGLKLETSNNIWDLSVAHKLAQLREVF